MKPGYWQSNYFPANYWLEDYWQGNYFEISYSATGAIGVTIAGTSEISWHDCQSIGGIIISGTSTTIYATIKYLIFNEREKEEPFNYYKDFFHRSIS